MLMTFFYCTQALAEDFILQVSEEIDLELGGTWAIPIHDGYRWWMGMGQASDLWVAPLYDANWYVEMPLTKNLSNRGDLFDHSIRRCPDGSYLHVATAQLQGQEAVPNYIFRYDENFDMFSSNTFAQGTPAHANNDIPAICGEYFQGFAIAQAQGRQDFFVETDGECNTIEAIELPDAPRMTGAGLWEENGQLITVGMDPGPDLTVSVYDTDFVLQNRYSIAPFAENIIHYWPSRIVKLGYYYIIATMGRDPSVQFPLDTGDMYLVVVDENFQTKQWVQISENDPNVTGGMRPWFDIHDDQLLLGYDKHNSLYLYEVILNTELFTTDPNVTEPSAEPSTEPSAEPSTEPSAEPDTSKDTGCKSKGAVALPFPLFLLWLTGVFRRADRK